MSNFWQLTGIQLRNLFFQSRSRRKGTKAGIGFMVFQMGLMVYLAVIYSFSLYQNLPPAAYDLGAYLMIAAGTMLVLMIGVPYSQGQLFGFRDFDFLMTLPVSRQTIVASKIVTFLIMQYLYSAFFMIPAMIVYGVMAGQQMLFYLLMAVGFLTLPLLPTVLAALIGLLVKSISTRMRHQNAVRLILNVALVGLMFAFSFHMNATNDPMPFLSQALPKIRIFLPQVYWYVSGCVSGQLLPVLLSMLFSAAVFAAFLYFAAPTILRVGAKGEQGYHVKNFRLKREASQALLPTLLKKEFGYLLSNVNYLLNMCFGIVMMIGLSVYVVLKRDTIAMMMMEIGVDSALVSQILPAVILIAIGLMGHSSCTTGVSISLEGKSFWIIQTLPVSIRQIFLAKGLVDFLIIIVPSLLCLLMLGIGFAIPWQYYLIGTAYLLLLAAFVSMYGLFINLHFPKLDFDRDIVVIKQSMASFLSILGSMMMGIAVFLLYGRFTADGGSSMTFLLALIGVYLLLDLLLWFYLEHGGQKAFRKLN